MSKGPLSDEGSRGSLSDERQEVEDELEGVKSHLREREAKGYEPFEPDRECQQVMSPCMRAATGYEPEREATCHGLETERDKRL